MDNAGIGSWLDRRIVMTPDSAALIFDGSMITYRELTQRTRRLAHGLRSLGVDHGSRISYIGSNHPAALEMMFAAGMLGATYLPINPRLTVDEIRFILSDSDCSTVVFGPDHSEIARTLQDAVGAPKTWVSRDKAPHWCEHSYDSVIGDQPDTPIRSAVDADDLALLIYSSGTTGSPKGVMLSHSNMLWNALNQVLSQNITSHDRTMATAPLAHIGGLAGNVTATLLQGATVVLLEKFDPDLAIDTIERENITTFFAVPTMLQQLWHHPRFGEADFSALRSIGVAGAPLPEVLIGPWHARGVEICQAYGLTEASPGVASLSPGDVETKIGSAGKRQMFTDLDILRPDGSSAAPGEIGEIVAKGPTVMMGYLNQPEETARTIVNGWLHTGDAGYFDDDGFLFVCDRFKDMYISGGENVYPAEVEAALLELEDVAEASVIGVPHDKWGETGMAFLVAAHGAVLDVDTVRSHLRQKLAGFKVPTFIQITTDLPRTSTGKIRKPELRRIADSLWV